MSSPALPLTLALAAAAADGGGLHRVAFYLVLLAVAPAAIAALSAAGELAEGRRVLVRTALCAAALALLVTSSAARANAAPTGAPPLALSALVGCLGAYAAIGLGWLLRGAPKPVPAAERVGS
ncbi:MAG TPA: hypothetical protein VH416_05560 [Gaiellaceae bacterium]|jgi:hypothetical protein